VGAREHLPLLVAASAGVLFALTAPPTNLTLATLLGLSLFYFSLTLEAPRSRRSRVSGALRGLCFGTAANLVALRFVPSVIVRFTPLPAALAYLALLLLSMAQGLGWAAAGALTRWLQRIHVPPPLAFAVAVFASTFLPAVFPWTPAGGLTQWPFLVQIADIIGERGVTFCWSFVCAGVVTALRYRHPPSLVAALAMLAVLVHHGLVVLPVVRAARAEAPAARIGLLQPSTEAKERWEKSRAEDIVRRLHVLTKESEVAGAELTVWPEAAYPYTLSHEARRDDYGAGIVGYGLHGPILAGLILRGPDASYNSAVLARGDGSVSPSQDKIRLLAFGEHVPFAEELPWLRKAFVRGTGLLPGKKNVLLRSEKLALGVLNCFEDTLTAASRDAFRDERGTANLLVNITNDAWFSESSESELHEHLSVLRAVELRRDLVRSVNQGPLSLVSATGAIETRLYAHAPSTLLVRPRLLDLPPTLYATHGDAPILTLCFGTLLLAAALSRRAHRS
jgi:apolipoprotein N-acyltransferase